MIATKKISHFTLEIQRQRLLKRTQWLANSLKIKTFCKDNRKLNRSLGASKSTKKKLVDQFDIKAIQYIINLNFRLKWRTRLVSTFYQLWTILPYAAPQPLKMKICALKVPNPFQKWQKPNIQSSRGKTCTVIYQSINCDHQIHTLFNKHQKYIISISISS